MCVFRELLSARKEGPFAVLGSGDASEHVEPFPEIGRFSDEARREINEVWNGRRRRCLQFDYATGELFLFDHTRTGEPRSGRYYGYVVRRIKLAEPPAPKTEESKPNFARRFALLTAVALLTVAAAWVMQS